MTHTTSFMSINLAPAFNCAFTQEAGLSRIIPGQLPVAKLNFEIVDSNLNEGKSLLALSLDEPDLSAQTEIKLSLNCNWIYLLHTLVGANLFKNHTTGILSFIYEDGSEAKVEIRPPLHLADGCYPRPTDAAQQIAITGLGPNGETDFLFAAWVQNPKPALKITSLTLQCLGAKDKWLILAMAASTGENLLAPSSRSFEVDLKQPQNLIRRLHGTNLAAPIFGQELAGVDISDDLRELDIPLTRLHDAPWENAGLKLIDIPHLFPLFHADATDPRNYCFAATDDYIANCLIYGSKVMFRLGTSIEHSKRKYSTHPPADFHKWAEICEHIIRHYNEGWANGFHHNIEYWEIWNEADIGPKMWTGSWKDYIELYCVTAKRLKARFPTIKIGGPAIASARLKLDLVHEFLAECKTREAPLDFFSWHCYKGSPEFLISQPALVRHVLDAHGFPATELNLNEWHYMPGDWDQAFNRKTMKWFGEEMSNRNGAAFITALLTGWQDSPLTMANHYTGSMTMIGGLFGIINQDFSKTKCYHALAAFNRLTKYPNRVTAKTDNAGSIWALAGTRADGGVAVLLTAFQGSNQQFIIKFNGLTPVEAQCKLSVIDDTHDLTPYENFTLSGNTLVVSKPAGSWILLLEIAR